MDSLEKLDEEIGGFHGVLDSQVNRALMVLKQKEIDEQVRSNKVIEGVLKDIFNGIDRAASCLSEMNERDERIYTINERDIMNEKGTPLNEQVGNVAEEQKQKIVTEQLADILYTLTSDNEHLVTISGHIKSLNKMVLPSVIEAVQHISGQIMQIKINMRNAADGIAAIAGKEKPEPEPETEAVVLPVHCIRYPDELALCGALGTLSQPNAARQNERVTSVVAEITCTECLGILASRKA